MIAVNTSGPSPRGITKRHLTRAVASAFSAARRNPRGSVGLRFVSEKEIAALNRRYRNLNRPTDVLSFAAPSEWSGRLESKEWGDVVIATSFARRDARKCGVDMKEQVLRLAVHGTLHLLGYDHATAAQERRMVRMQENAVRQTVRSV